MKTKDLKSGYHIFGNKGNLWSNGAHIAEDGYSPTTLCGVPMLSTNHCRNEKEIGCKECIDIYNLQINK